MSCVIKNLTKIYPFESGENVIFDNFSLEFQTDEITVFLGKSGCGKTTFLRLLADLEDMDAGEIDFFDEKGAKIYPKIGMVFQEPRLLPWRDVLGNVLIHQEKQEESLGLKWLAQVGLADYAHTYPDELSGGMSARVAIARALSYEPELLLMDEPFAALDYFTRAELEKETIRLSREQNLGVVFITHDLDEALLMAKKIVVLKKGENAEEFQIDEDYHRDLTAEKMITLKKALLNILEK